MKSQMKSGNVIVDIIRKSIWKSLLHDMVPHAKLRLSPPCDRVLTPIDNATGLQKSMVAISSALFL